MLVNMEKDVKAIGLTDKQKLDFYDHIVDGLEISEGAALAALTVYYEAAGESFAGKLAVAAVIRNRMKLKYQSDGTVKGTVLKARQFQPWSTRKPSHIPLDLKKKSMRDSLLAWRLVQDGRNVVDGAVLFYNPKLVRTPYWAKVSQRVTTIGDHEFYTPPSRRT